MRRKLDNIKRLEEYISNQKVSKFVSVKYVDVKYKVKIDWKPKNPAKEALSTFIKEFKQDVQSSKVTKDKIFIGPVKK